VRRQFAGYSLARAARCTPSGLDFSPMTMRICGSAPNFSGKHRFT